MQGKNLRNERIGQERINSDGNLMRCIEYNTAHDITVLYIEHDKTVKTCWKNFNNGHVTPIGYDKHDERINSLKYNNQNYLMKCITYNGANDIVVEFQDEYKAQVHTAWKEFKNGEVRNPYSKNVYGGIFGEKYSINSIWCRKIYSIWMNMLIRCNNQEYQNTHPTYNDISVCEEWMYFPNFYEWIILQDNFMSWYNASDWDLDKDILIKGNKIYSPNACCLVPNYVNKLFTKCSASRGDLPIGVILNKSVGKYEAGLSMMRNRKNIKSDYIGVYETPEEAFYLGYKPAKEQWIKEVAQEEYDKGNITKRCYDAMMKYEVEITD